MHINKITNKITVDGKLSMAALPQFLKPYFWEMFSVTLTFEPVTFTMSSVSRGLGNK